MDSPSNTLAPERPHLSLLDRTAALSAWALGGAVFLTIGWFGMAPDDPLGPVSLLTRTGPVSMLLIAVLLAGVVSALATLLAGRLLPSVGVFTAALGLAAVALKGTTAGALLIQYAAPSERLLGARLLVDALGWIVVGGAAIAAEFVVRRWCFGASPHPRTPRSEGVKHAAITAGLGLILIAALSQGLQSRGTSHGQVCFVIAAGVWLAAYMAHRTVAVRSPLWSIVAVWAITLIAYLWAAVRPVNTGLPPTFPSSHFLRMLPIQFVAVGTVAAVVAYWQFGRPDVADEQGSRPPSTSD